MKTKAKKASAPAQRAKKEQMITVRLSSEAYAELEKKAQAEDRKVAYVARRAILESLGLDAKAA